MRKIKSFVLAVIGLLCSMSVSAHDFEVDGIYYNITSSTDMTVEVTYHGDDPDVYENKYSGDVSISKSVTYNGCTYSVSSIGNYAFKNCFDLTSVQIPNSVTSIEEGAFESCASMTSVQIPNSVTSIGVNVFWSCSSLTSVVIGNSVTSIGRFAFSGCSNLTSVQIPNSMTYIGDWVFSYCSSLTSVVIPNSVTSIGDYAFEECSSLTSVQIPNSVTNIGDYAFEKCSSLTSVQIPNSVTSIGRFTFSGCSNLTSVTVAEDNPVYDSRDNCNAIIKTETNTLIAGCSTTTIPNSVTDIVGFSGCSSLTSVVIPNSVTYIGNSAFQDCTGLTSIEIPNSVTDIGMSAFFGCKGLISVQIPNSVTSINNYTFKNCSSLTFVQIPNSVTRIGNYAFEKCSRLTSVQIPNSVTSIGEYAYSSCSRLTTITLLSQTPPTISSSTFSKYDATLYVPYGSKTAYSTAEYWENFTKIVELTPSYDLTVSTAGYATLYLNYATEIPEGVEVYTAKEVDGIWLKMAQVEEVLPAHTAVIVKAPAGIYTFVQTATDVPAITDNLLKGTNEDTYIDVPSNSKAFVLSMVDGEVGMYLAKLTDGRFLNNANKAYLLLDNNKLGLSDEELDTSVGGAQLSLRFDFGGATGVDKVQTETAMNNATYDMYGRKVNKITTPGLYIVNGKKVWVK